MSLPLHLSIDDVPQYPFVSQEFKFKVRLLDAVDRIRTGKEIGVTLKFFVEGSPSLVECPEYLTITDNSDLVIPSSGVTTIGVKPNKLSQEVGMKSFVIIVYAVNGDDDDEVICPARSMAMFVVRYQLVIKNYNGPHVWYKDEGKREKCIEFLVYLQDFDLSNQAIQWKKEVPLRLRVRYMGSSTTGLEPKGEQSVSRTNSILEILPASKTVIDDLPAYLKIRYKDISKNHQNREFVIEVSPDAIINPDNFDISPAYCPPIYVKSKRPRLSKRQRDEEEAILAKRRTSRMLPDLTWLAATSHIPVKSNQLSYTMHDPVASAALPDDVEDDDTNTTDHGAVDANDAAAMALVSISRGGDKITSTPHAMEAIEDITIASRYNSSNCSNAEKIGTSDNHKPFEWAHSQAVTGVVTSVPDTSIPSTLKATPWSSIPILPGTSSRPLRTGPLPPPQTALSSSGGGIVLPPPLLDSGLLLDPENQALSDGNPDSPRHKPSIFHHTPSRTADITATADSRTLPSEGCDLQSEIVAWARYTYTRLQQMRWKPTRKETLTGGEVVEYYEMCNPNSTIRDLLESYPEKE